MHAMQAIQVKQPPTNQSVTRGRHMDPWAHKGMQTAPKQGGHRELTSGPTEQSPRESTPRVGPKGVARTDLVAPTQGLPRGACPLVLEAIPGVFGCSHTGCTSL